MLTLNQAADVRDDPWLSCRRLRWAQPPALLVLVVTLIFT